MSPGFSRNALLALFQIFGPLTGRYKCGMPMGQMVSELYKTPKVLERLMSVARLSRRVELDQLPEPRI